MRSLVRSVYKTYAVKRNGKKNELPPFNVFGLVHLQRGGNSPVSTYCIYQWIHASTACDLLANLLEEICLSIHTIDSASTVTLRCGLLSTLIYTKIVSKVINSHKIQYTIILLSCRIGVLNDRNQPTSESYKEQPGRTELVGISRDQRGNEFGNLRQHTCRRICGDLCSAFDHISELREQHEGTGPRNLAGPCGFHDGSESVRCC